MKKVLVLGGTFNPITNSHLDIVKSVSEILDIKEVYFLIAKNPRWKDTLDIKHRLNMLNLALKDYQDYKILDLEIKSNKEINYTFDTMNEFKSDDKEIYYIIGTDQLNKLDKWYKIDELKDIVHFVLVRREGYEVNTDFIKQYNVIDLNIKGSSTSSTLIREYKSKDTPKQVLDYIYDNHLYIKDSLKSLLKEKRYYHSCSVATLAKEIAHANHLDEEKCYLAGLVHDVAKYFDDKTEDRIMKERFPKYLSKNKAIYHQYIGSYVIQELYHIYDEEIIDAVKFHTTSRLNASKIGKVIFVSDKLDPLRGYDSSKLIELCKQNIDLGYIACLKDNIDYLNKHHVEIDEESRRIYMEALHEQDKLLLDVIYKTLDDKKATNIEIIDMRTHSADYSYFIIASVDNNRLCKACAYAVEDELARNNYEINHIEGKNDDEWVLVDANDYIIHIFVKDARQKYNLEKLYRDLDRVTL